VINGVDDAPNRNQDADLQHQSTLSVSLLAMEMGFQQTSTYANVNGVVDFLSFSELSRQRVKGVCVVGEHLSLLLDCLVGCLDFSN
jgi:hypothetical protein